LQEFGIKTSSRNCTVDITDKVVRAVRDSGVKEGVAIVYVPHTTAAVTINEGADPDVRTDILSHLCKLVPHSADFKHFEGNSDAHIKSTLVGASATVIFSGGSLVLGRWQSIFFCEFDGPRSRRFYVKIIAG
jgi:secondary thiamine-phosphate synthase enzyme